MSKTSTKKGKRALSASKHPEAKSSFDGEWRDTKTAEQCLAHLCLTDHLSDMTFTFGGDPSVKLPAHKFILSMRSAVFEAMFNGPLAEGDTVQIKDVEPEAMKVLLRFVYTDKPDLNGDTVLSCLYAAKKYGLIGLVRQCSEFLERNIDKENVCSIHEQAVFYEMDSLREQCFDYILENAPDVFATTGFLKISQETVFKLFKDDSLSPEEIDIYNAAVRWAQYKCKAEKLPKSGENERKILGKILYQIRFPIMPIEEFGKVVTPTGILTNEELVMLYQFNATKGSSPLSKFNKERRSGKMVTVDITQYIDEINQGDVEGYYLQFNRNSYYGRKGMHNSCTPFNELKVISVKGTFVKNVGSITLGDTSEVSYRTVGNKILFQTPVEIGPGDAIQFHPTDWETYDCTSSHVNIQENINYQLVNIVSVPVGLETISFEKNIGLD